MRTVIKKLTLIVLTVSLLCTAAFAADNAAPTMTATEESGSTLEAGSKVVITVRDESKIVELVRYWENGTEKVETPNNIKATITLTLGTAPGKYVYHVEATDEEGNCTGDKSFVYYVASDDEEAPTVSLSEESGSTLEAGTKIVATFVDESKVAEVKYYWQGDDESVLTPNTTKHNLTVALGKDPGKYILHLEATDKEGNCTGDKSYVYYVEAEDEEAPQITASEESGSVLDGGSIIRFTVKDDSKISEIKYYWQGSEEKTLNPNVTERSLRLALGTQGGKYILHIEATDEAGNSTGDKTFVYYVPEEDAPVITLNYKSGSTLPGGTVIKARVADDSKVTKITYNWHGSDEVVVSKNTNIVNMELTLGTQGGKYILYMTAEDEYGNKTEKQTYVFNVEAEDNDVPVITANPESGSTLTGGTKINVRVEDESKVAKITYNWHGGKEVVVNDAAHQTNIVNMGLTLGTEPGKYILYVTAEDKKGNVTDKETFVYYVDAEDEDAPTITVSPKSGSTLPAGAEIKVKVEDESKISKITYNWHGNPETVINDAAHQTNIVNMDLTLGSEEGKYILHVTAVDKKGNSTEKQSYVFYVEIEDNEAPTVTVNPKSGSTVEGGDIIVAIPEDNEELSKIEYYWDNDVPHSKNISGTSTRVNMPAIPEEVGEHILHVKVTDAAGNTTGWKTYTYYIKADENEKPTIEVSPEAGTTITPEDDVKVTVKDKEGLAGIEYAWDDQTPISKAIDGTEKTLTMPKVPETPGKHTLHVTVTDEAGVTTTGDFDFYVPEVDDEVPTITMDPKSKTTVPGGKIIKATLRDNIELAKVEYHWDDADTATKTLTGALKTISLPAIKDKEGTYYMHIKLTDAVGNTTGWETHIYYVEEDEGDGEDPEVFADPDGGDVEYGDRITLWAEDKDDIEYIEYYWDDDDDTTVKYKDEFTVKVPSDEGKHYLYVRAMDQVGDMCGWERFVYNIEENNYPGNPDITGEINDRVKNVRVEIRNADDKIKFEPEEEILYYVDYYNGSSSKLTNAKLVVDLPTYLKATDASDDGKITSTKVTWSLGTLKAGDYGRVSFTAEYTSDKYNEKIITVPAKIYSGSSLKDTSTVRNLIYCDDGSGTGSHQAYCIGYPDGSFRPNGNITRAELAQMIANIEGLRGTYRGQFIDVPQDHWAASAIQACVDKGYVLSVGFSSFAPEQPATRGELAYAIAAALGVQDLEPIFINSTDLENSDFRCSMEQLLRLGIMDGYSNGTARPNASIIRAEAVTIINNYLFRGELVVSRYGYGYGNVYNYDTGYNYGGNGTVLSFTDLATSHWAYGHIMEATNHHKYERVLDGNEKML